MPNDLSRVRRVLHNLVWLVEDQRPVPRGQPPRPFDFACAECCVPPYVADSVVIGFRCPYHEAVAVLAEPMSVAVRQMAGEP